MGSYCGGSHLSRRDVLRVAVTIGSTTGIAGCIGDNGTIPSGDPENRPNRQHAWNAVLHTDNDGNHVPPEHHVLLGLSLHGDVTEAARDVVEHALSQLEAGYAYDPDGLLFAIGYSPTYFEHIGVESPIPHPIALSNQEDTDIDTVDAIVHLASNHAQAVLEAENALVGDADPEKFDPILFDDVFELYGRRSGFVGSGLPAAESDHPAVPDAIPEEAPFLMGFRSGFAESQAPEDRVTLDSGKFQGGTTMHIESSTFNLRQWYEQDSHDQRVAKLFSPAHADIGIGTIGEVLDTDPRVLDQADNTRADARNRGIVGHAQKAARARDADGTPPLLRRDVNTLDNDQPGLHFISYQRSISEFIAVREAMNGTDLTGSGVGSRHNNGILQYIHVTRRGNFLIPPREQRALPTLEPTS